MAKPPCFLFQSFLCVVTEYESFICLGFEAHGHQAQVVLHSEAMASEILDHSFSTWALCWNHSLGKTSNYLILKDSVFIVSKVLRVLQFLKLPCGSNIHLVKVFQEAPNQVGKPFILYMYKHI